MGKKYQQVTPQVDSRWRLGTTATLATLVLFLTVYLPLAGQGFVRDDYAWILQSRVTSPDDLVGLLSRDIGFYRPMVGLTFAVNEWFFGVSPWGYGLTNLLLALGCAVSIVALGRAMGLPRGGALVAGALWLLHAEFLPIGVLWISGRTALVMILAATASAAALLGGRFWPALAWLAVALFSKEEAVVLPFVLLGWLIIRPSAIRPLAWAMGAGTLVVIYLIARTFAGATNPANAPAFYRLTFEPAIVMDNLVWYAIHGAWTAAIVAVLGALVLHGKPERTDGPRAPGLNSILMCSALWIAGSFALTIWIPVRSHLYLALPAVGVCLAAAAFCTQRWSHASPVRQRAALVVAIVFVAAMVPVHLRGAHEWAMRTEFAATVLRDLDVLTSGLPAGSHVVLNDDRNDPHGNLAAVFGTMASDAGALVTEGPMDIWIEPPPPHAEIMGLRPPCADCADLRLQLVAGRLRLKH